MGDDTDKPIDVTDKPIDVTDPEQQEARAYLRERFLRTITRIVGKQCEFQMYGNTVVSAEFGGSDVDVLNFFVNKLQTPTGLISHAILRTNDIISFSIPNADSLPKSQ